MAARLQAGGIERLQNVRAFGHGEARQRKIDPARNELLAREPVADGRELRRRRRPVVGGCDHEPEALVPVRQVDGDEPAVLAIR